MDRLENFAQTYSQAPWRKQLQIIGLFFSGLVFLALVAGIYLNVSARAATTGREIQELQKTSEDTVREIEDLRSRLALIRSSSEMSARAIDMGFELVEPDQIFFLKVLGYREKESPSLAPLSEQTIAGAPAVPTEYTESLFTWIKRQANRMYLDFFEVGR
jgi:cell division protein FtsB